MLAACVGHPKGSIGAVLGKREDGRLYVRDVPAGMAGSNAGLEPGDEIVAIDGRDVRGMVPDAIRTAVRGDVGSTVVITVVRGALRRDVKIQRGPFRQGGS